MALYVLDTGILLGFARGASFAKYVNDQYAPTTPPNAACASVVSIGEIRCFPIRRHWGDDKKAALETLLKHVPQVDISHDLVVHRYAEIKTYCEGQNPSRPLPKGVSAHSMGDNDLWIASTASVLNAQLITTDKDFLFLDGVFLGVVWIDQAQT